MFGNLFVIFGERVFFGEGGGFLCVEIIIFFSRVVLLVILDLYMIVVRRRGYGVGGLFILIVFIKIREVVRDLR